MKNLVKISAAILLSSFTFLPTASAAKSNDSLTTAWESMPRTFDPRYAIDANSQYLEDLIHCSLIGFDRNGAISNHLAEKIEWNTPTQLKVTLKQGIKYSNGNVVKPQDVVATYQSLLPEMLSPASPRASAFKKISKISHDKKSVTFTLTEADSTFITNLVVGILPNKTPAKILTFDNRSSGCGPFVLHKKDVNALTLVRNEKYNLGPKPKLSKIVFKIVKDESTRLAKLRKGELDLVQNLLSRHEVKNIIKKYPTLTTQHKPALKTTYIGFNMQDKLLQNKAIRQAISIAIDREKIIKYVLSGFATPAQSLLTPNDPYLDPSIGKVTFDREKARKLLDAAGFKQNGKKPRFKLSYKTTQNATRINIAKAIAADLNKIGIKVTVQPLEWGRFKSDVEKGHVQLWSLSWIGFKDPDIYRYVFATESHIPNGGNRGRYSNSNLDKLLSQARITTDMNKRKSLYRQVQTILADELPYVFLWHEENFAVFNKSVNDFELYADGRFSSFKKVYKK